MNPTLHLNEVVMNLPLAQYCCCESGSCNNTNYCMNYCASKYYTKPILSNSYIQSNCMLEANTFDIQDSHLDLQIGDFQAQKKRGSMLDGFRYAKAVRNDEENKPSMVYICKYPGCNKEFKRSWNILDHMRIHEGLKPFQCNYCGRSFTQRGNLTKHIRRHTIPDIQLRKRYKCEICQTGYTEKYNYKSHMKKYHTQ